MKNGVSSDQKQSEEFNIRGKLNILAAILKQHRVVVVEITLFRIL